MERSDWAPNRVSVPKSARKDHNLRRSTCSAIAPQTGVSAGFRRCSRDSAPRLKIVVSPVRVRVSPSHAPKSRLPTGFSSSGWNGARPGIAGTRNGRGVPVSSPGPRRARNACKTPVVVTQPAGRCTDRNGHRPFPAFSARAEPATAGNAWQIRASTCDHGRDHRRPCERRPKPGSQA
jgi:hypothetical protein